LTLWDYALAAWRRPAVEAACLDLQTAHAQSEPLLLWRLWTLAEGRPVDDAMLEIAVAAARTWESAVIGPLRLARGALKTASPGVPDEARMATREQVRAAELATEHMLLDALDAVTPAPAGHQAEPLAALTNLAAAWGAPAPTDALNRLLAAAL
jgi:uncharacterized protein (TIGR02444 family)